MLLWLPEVFPMLYWVGKEMQFGMVTVNTLIHWKSADILPQAFSFSLELKYGCKRKNKKNQITLWTLDPLYISLEGKSWSLRTSMRVELFQIMYMLPLESFYGASE